MRDVVRGTVRVADTPDGATRQVLKIDKHKYVKIAYHGFKPLSRQERLDTYSNSQVLTFSLPVFCRLLSFCGLTCHSQTDLRGNRASANASTKCKHQSPAAPLA